jgi:hypothetical protein
MLSDEGFEAQAPQIGNHARRPSMNVGLQNWFNSKAAAYGLDAWKGNARAPSELTIGEHAQLLNPSPW